MKIPPLLETADKFPAHRVCSLLEKNLSELLLKSSLRVHLVLDFCTWLNSSSIGVDRPKIETRNVQP
jgi:hypothetical protein